jgi:HTH-type transcriptional regulator/antitoxin HigA
LIYLPHLSHTHLDGAAMQLEDGTPVIGLTLRYDRLDNFWFCVCHELAHVSLHMSKGLRSIFVDDLSPSAKTDRRNDREREADDWAQESLIPVKEWQASGIGAKPTVSAILGLAQKLGIHPAIIAGRVRRETGNYHLFTHYVGNGEVVKHFEEPAAGKNKE